MDKIFKKRVVIRSNKTTLQLVTIHINLFSTFYFIPINYQTHLLLHSNMRMLLQNMQNFKNINALLYFTGLFFCYNCLRSFIINCNSPIFCVILFGLKNHVIKTKILCLCKILVSVYLQITVTSIKGYSAFNLR